MTQQPNDSSDVTDSRNAVLDITNYHANLPTDWSVAMTDKLGEVGSLVEAVYLIQATNPEHVRIITAETYPQVTAANSYRLNGEETVAYLRVQDRDAAPWEFLTLPLTPDYAQAVSVMLERRQFWVVLQDKVDPDAAPDTPIVIGRAPNVPISVSDRLARLIAELLMVWEAEATS